MTGQANAMFYQMQHSSRMLGGVCAHFADRCGLPVWVVRVVALVLLVLHPPLVVALYICAAIWVRSQRVSPATSWRAPPCEAVRPSWDRDGLTTRFYRLDRRLADLERAALDREAGLHRAFRDLDAKRK